MNPSTTFGGPPPFDKGGLPPSFWLHPKKICAIIKSETKKGAEFMDHKTSLTVARIGIAVMLLLLAITYFTDTDVLGAIGGVIGMASILQTLIYDRCPHCEAFLYSLRHPNIKYCPECGEKLDDE